MDEINFDSLLPNESSSEYKKAMKENPSLLLIEYANAFNKKYKGKVKAKVENYFERKTRARKNEVISEDLVIALYFEAAIARGYLYKLLEVVQVSRGEFPLKVIVFQNNPGTLGTYKDYNSYKDDMIKFLGSSFVKFLIVNLLAKVELYNESRNQTFSSEGQVPPHKWAE